MITKINGVKIVLALCSTYAPQTIADISIQKYEFIGMRNVWHERDMYHEDLNVGDPDEVGQSKVLQLCSNECTLAKDDCDGFYITKMSEEPINTTCHLVDHRKKDYTIGHGEDTDKVYYVKKQVGSPVTFTKPVDLIPPCDQDRNTLESSTCDEYRALGPIQYYNCTTCDRCSYRLTVSQYMKDDACEDEDRIIQCELENENVTANIQIDPSMSKHSLLKAWQQSGQGMVVATQSGTNLEWIEYTFKSTEGPREMSRLIIRSLPNDLDHIHKGSVVLYRQNPAANFNRTIDFPHEDDCVMAINFGDSSGHFTADEREIIKNTFKVRINIDSTHTLTKSTRGFKADLFVKKKVSY